MSYRRRQQPSSADNLISHRLPIDSYCLLDSKEPSQAMWSPGKLHLFCIGSVVLEKLVCSMGWERLSRSGGGGDLYPPTGRIYIHEQG